MSSNDANKAKVPAAIGPYSRYIEANGFVFTSGQIPIDPATGDIVSGGIAEQTAQALENLKNVLNEAGVNVENVVKTTVYIKSMKDFSWVNEIYGGFFKQPYPARTCVEVSELPKGALVEIEAVARK